MAERVNDFDTPGSTFRLDSVTPAGGLWVDGELAGTEVFALRA